MQFGLWFEPEMVNLDSDCAREHPDWILAAPEAVPCREDISYRTQYVLDLANPRCLPPCARADGRPDPRTGHRLHQVGPQPRRDRAGARRPLRPARADRGRLPAEFPGLEIESCASGGGRADAGILQHADRIWASDSNDPRDRVDIQRTTELVVPPEMIGAHIGPSPAHSTWRATDLSYRAAMSLEGCSGFEWNILECTDEEIAQITAFVKLVKELRGLLHAGEVRHADFHDPALRARGVVADDLSLIHI